MSETDQENQAAGAENNQDTLLGGAPQETENRPSENPPEGGVQDRPSENGANPPPEKPAVPEQYEFKPPEGVEFDEATIGVYAEAAREAGLSQEAADIVLNKIAPHLAQQQAARLAEARNDWARQSRADAEFGGGKLDENLAVAKKAVEALASPELKTLLEQSGLGNHPEIIRLFYRAGRSLSQDGFVGGKAAQMDARSIFSESNMNP
ncbi:hypothetical protein [Neisseria bacilliformis]|uniref:hypothetical protein n=1 Tax=Neisseria bacilliformis TaxID=267212 RepID=UPI0028E33122|nr:hypothetical protein [Neisseria bacilliformis]